MKTIKTESAELRDIFNVSYGNKFDLNKMPVVDEDLDQDGVAFVGRSGKDNGITAFVGRVENVKPYEAGLITVALGGAILSSFVQPRPFYTGQNVAVLEPKAPMSIAEKLYYCLCIERNRHRYSAFGREANRTLKVLEVPPRADLPKWAGTSFDAVRASWLADFEKMKSVGA